MNRLYNETSVQNIADAIREKKGYTGKNLFNLNSCVKGRIDNGVIGYESGTTSISFSENSITFVTNANYRGIASDYIEIDKDLTYFLGLTLSSEINVLIDSYDEQKNWIKREKDVWSSVSFQTSSNAKYIRISFQGHLPNEYVINSPQLEEGSATSYEPYCRYKIGDMENAIDTLKVIAEQEATGYPLNLTKGINGRTLDYKVYGNSKQETTTGKNLFDYESARDINNTTLSAYRLFEIGNLTPNALYDLTGFSMTAPTSGYIYLWSEASYAGSNKALISNPTSIIQADHLAFNANSEGKMYLAIFDTTEAIWNENILYFEKAMLRLASITDRTYEPYTGGQPSPSPDYPQEIKSVGDLVTSGEHTGKYKIPVISSGKNKLNNTLNTQTLNGVTFTVNNDKSITIKGTASARTEPRLWTSSSTDTLKLLANTTYYNYSGDVLYFYGSLGYKSIANNGSYTPSTDENINYIYIRVENAETIDKTIYPILTDYNDNTYEPYYKPITTNIYLDKPLRKIGNVKDEINFANGKRINNIGEIILDGVNSKIDSVAQAGNLYYATCNLTKNSKQNYELMSNMFIAGYLDEGKFYIANASGSIMVFVHTNQTLTTKELWNNWLTTHNVEAIYQLGTPTEETIDIPPIPTFEGTTIITIGSETEPTEMYAKYYKFV